MHKYVINWYKVTGGTMTKLRGAFTALITPMNPDGSVDYDGFRTLVRYQLEQGISGLVPLGTTGETPTLDESEEEKIIEIAMAEAGGKVPVILGAGSNSTRDAVKYVKRAKAAGADYALVVTPYYNKPNDEGIYRHFEACAEVGLPIIVYNIVGRTGKHFHTAFGTDSRAAEHRRCKGSLGRPKPDDGRDRHHRTENQVSRCFPATTR